MTILIVDDEADLREILQFNLEAAQYSCLCAESAEQALEIIDSGAEMDLILLDVMLPGMSGFKMADVLRKRHSSIPIIFLTARTAENDLLTGFSAGGDDYIGKPFSINEVLARVRAVLKRSKSGADSSSILQLRELCIDNERKKVFYEGRAIELSKKEYDILLLLCSNPGKQFSRAEFIDLLWKDSPYILERTVDVHIARIRTKLGEKGKNLIVNRPGFGYSFRCDDTD